MLLFDTVGEALRRGEKIWRKLSKNGVKVIGMGKGTF